MDGGRAGGVFAFVWEAVLVFRGQRPFVHGSFSFFFSPSRSRAEVRAVHKVSSSSQLSERLSMFDISSR